MIQGLSFLRTRGFVVAAGSCLALLLTASPGRAEIPVFPAVDDRGVDVVTGAFIHTQTDVAIGQPGAGGLAYTRYYQSGSPGLSTHNHNGYIYASGSNCIVVLATVVDTFASSNCLGSFTSNLQNGSTLAHPSAYSYVYTTRDGTVAAFQVLTDTVLLNMPQNAKAYLLSVTTPDGEVSWYSYEGETFCYPDPVSCWGTITYSRLQSVYNNFGYRLYLSYPDSVWSLVQPNKVTAINNAVEYCVPGSCGQSWPSATYTYAGGPHVASVTNALGDPITYTYSGSDLLTELQFPDNANHYVNITHASGRVTSIDLGFGTWSYAYSDAGGERTTTVTNPGSSSTRTYISTLANGRIESVTNELSQTVSYQYDSWYRLARVTAPEGNYTQYTRDGRGNITQTRFVAKSGSGLADVVTSAAYMSYCSFPSICNKPMTTTDALGYRTDYTYHQTHGGVLTITAPAPSGSAPVGSGDRPETRFSYVQKQARYLTGTSTWVSGSPVWRLTQESACAAGTSPSCLNTVNETRTTIDYPGSTTPNNLQPVSTTIAAGNGAVSSTSTMTYTSSGQLKTVDGPLSGAADTTRFYYDEARRLIGVVGPDPNGTLKYRAVGTTLNEIGQPTAVSRGTVANQGDNAFSTFSVLANQETEYDQYARPVLSRLLDGSTPVALSQFSYHSRGWPLCAAVRMNPATFSSPPSSACTLATDGSYGPDRIRQTLYDATGRVTQEESAYGTSLAQTTASYTYTGNGQIATITNARGYRTTFEYDGFDRLVKRRYPDPSNTHQSSATDYEQLTFDAYGRLAQERKRSGDSFAYTYDNLGRITLRDAPSTQPDVSFGYDLLGRTTSTSQPGNALTMTHDALSRVTAVTSSVLGSVSYQYDSGGRRTRLTYPDGFFVTYSYNNAGEPMGIYENGSTMLVTFGYDNLGRRASLTRGNGVVTSYAFDAMSRLSTLAQNADGSSFDTTFGFSYNPSSQIVARTRTNGAFDWVPPGSDTDAYTANGLDQYTSAAGVTPGYDTRGNLTSDGTETYGYDFDNRMISATGGVSLSYDPVARLHEVTGAATTRFLYDDHDVIAEYDTTGTVLRRYVHGPGLDEPLVWYEGSGTSDERYLMADERGSVIGVTNESGAVTGVNRYDAYGVPGSGNDGRFQYTGQMWLDDVDLYHYKARVYDPELGRFLQTDPIGTAGGMNVYAYAAGDPVNATDPSGLDYYCINTRARLIGYGEGGADNIFIYAYDVDCFGSPEDVDEFVGMATSTGAGGPQSQAPIGPCWNGEQGNWLDGVSGFARQIGNGVMWLGGFLGSMGTLSPEQHAANATEFGSNNTNAGILGADLAPAAQLAIPVARLGYALSAARIPSTPGITAPAAVAMRNGLKFEYRLGTFPNTRMGNYGALSASRTDAQIIASAGRTNGGVNAGAGALAATAAGPGGCR